MYEVRAPDDIRLGQNAEQRHRRRPLHDGLGGDQSRIEDQELRSRRRCSVDCWPSLRKHGCSSLDTGQARTRAARR